MTASLLADLAAVFTDVHTTAPVQSGLYGLLVSTEATCLRVRWLWKRVCRQAAKRHLKLVPDELADPSCAELAVSWQPWLPAWAAVPVLTRELPLPAEVSPGEALAAVTAWLATGAWRALGTTRRLRAVVAAVPEGADLPTVLASLRALNAPAAVAREAHGVPVLAAMQQSPCTRVLRAPDGVSKLSLARGAGRLALSRERDLAEVWSVPELAACLHARRGAGHPLGISPDGREVFLRRRLRTTNVPWEGHVVSVWDTATDEITDIAAAYPERGVAVGPSGQVAFLGPDCTPQLAWRDAEGRWRVRELDHEPGHGTFAFGPDGLLLVSWTTAAAKVETLTALRSDTGEVVWSRNGWTARHIAWDGADRWLASWSLRPYRRGEETLDAYLASDRMEQVRVIDARTGATRLHVDVTEGKAWSAAFSPSGRWAAVVVGGDEEHVVVFDPQTGQVRHRLYGGIFHHGDVCFLTEDDVLAAAPQRPFKTGAVRWRLSEQAVREGEWLGRVERRG